ncbi:hypothetical protein KJY78_00515 [Canibacter sp. lx-45]|uniref:hypothetical protein n=1 Tax=Canibacter zhuwentaonis TaxID=2837491 RepID=UPI001BDBE7FF|nr:hypothetical protein [Canibacter zhuwentaonis]MBT1034842.1 hypothetical protein [Canibacter zhuwentaonis]
MRYTLALGSLLLGLVLLLLGVGKATFLAGPTELSLQSDATQQASYAVIPAAELAKLPHKNRSLELERTEAVLAVGSLNDVVAWVVPLGYEMLTVNPDSRSLVSQSVPAETSSRDLGSVPVAQSDLWQEVKRGEAGSGLLFDSELAQDQALLIATSEEGKSIGAVLTVNLTLERKTQWAGPLLTAGGVFTVLGAILYIIFVDRDRRGLGPRRGQTGVFVGLRNTFRSSRLKVKKRAAGQDSRIAGRAVAAAGLMTVSALLLSGCAQYWPDFAAPDPLTKEQQGQNSVVPNNEQLSRIVHELVTVSDAADTELNSEILEERFTGDALAQRKANYQIRKADGDYAVVPPYLLPERIGYELIQDTDVWPRTIFLTLNSSKENPDLEAFIGSGEAGSAGAKITSSTLGVLMTQNDPHSNYQVSRIFALRGGIQMPQAAPAVEGTAVLDNVQSSLVVAPKDLAVYYADLLTKGGESEHIAIFNAEGDAVLGRGGMSWVKSEEERIANQEHKASFSVSVAPREMVPTALSTGAGGALVAISLVENRVTEAQGNTELPVGTVVKSVSDLSGNVKKIEQQVLHQLLFYVPKQGNTENAKIQLLGSASELIGANG